MEKIRVMILEDDPVWMKSISDYIEKENDITVVKQASTKEEALQASFIYDVALLDLMLSEDDHNLSGLDVASQLYDRGLKKIIMLTSLDETDIILESFDSGAINYVTKSSYRDIPDIIREAYHDKISLHSDVSNLVVHELKKERKLKILTPTEREVYDLQEKGLSKPQIAQQLFKSVETVKKQLKFIKRKMK